MKIKVQKGEKELVLRAVRQILTSQNFVLGYYYYLALKNDNYNMIAHILVM